MFRRALRVESLCRRELLAADSLMDLSFDLNGDGRLTASDADRVIAELRDGGDDVILDINRDGIVTALDALQVINQVDRYEHEQTVWLVTVDRIAEVSGVEASLAGDYEQYFQEIESQLSRPIKVTHAFQVAIDGFALEITGSEARQLSDAGWVATIEPEQAGRTQTDRGPSFIKADEIWTGNPSLNLPAYKGEGIVVGIIDSGVDFDHASFAATAPGDGYQHVNPLGTGNFLGMCDPSGVAFDSRVTCNDKLIGLYDFTTETPVPSDDELHEHGTHVSGIAAGNPLNAPVPGTDETRDISGVAPRANLIVYDACEEVACYTTDVIQAIDQAILDDVDVLNLSLGGFPFTTTNLALRSAKESGIYIAVAAGNEGPDSSTIGNPAISPWLTAAANISHDRSVLSSLEITGPAPLPSPSVFEQVPGEDVQITVDIGPATIIDAGQVDSANQEGCNAFPADAFAGSIALIDRGTCFFVDKVTNAQNAGASAVVIANNEPDGLIIMSGVGGLIPSFMISRDSGADLRQWTTANANAEIRINAGNKIIQDPELGDIVLASSSRGPNLSFDVLTPAVAAPGTNVLAANPSVVGNEFAVFSGTSMASPHVTGAAALLRGLHPAWTAAEVQSALMLTAVPADQLKVDSTTAADPWDVGSGKIDVSAAANTGLVMDETSANFVALDTIPKSRELNLPGLVNSSLNTRFSWTRTVRSTAPSTTQWSATFQSPSGVSLEVEPSVFSLDPGATQQLTMTIDMVDAPTAPADWLFGEIFLTPDTTVSPVHFPVVSQYPANALEVVIAETSVGEGQGTVMARVFRTSDPAAASTVNLLVNDPNLATVQATISIAAGEVASPWFPISILDDVTPEFDNELSLTASLSGNASGEDLLTIVDDDRAFVETFEINQGASQRSIVDIVELEFDSNVQIDETVGPAFSIQNLDTLQFPTFTTMESTDNGKVKVTFEFTSGDSIEDRGSSSVTLANGNYRLQVEPSRVLLGGVPMAGGNEFVDQFFRKYADTNGSGVVDLVDFADFRQAFGLSQSHPSFRDDFDSDGDGTVGLADFGRFRAAFGS